MVECTKSLEMKILDNTPSENVKYKNYSLKYLFKITMVDLIA